MELVRKFLGMRDVRPTASLLVQQAFPSRGHPARGSRRGLIRRMRVRTGQLRTLKSFLRSIVVEPVFSGLEAIDDRVPGGCVVLRRVLAGRSIAAADVTAFGASAQM